MKRIFFIVIIFSASCTSTKQITSQQSDQPGNIVINGKIFASIYQQKAAEYRALCLQAYNIARVRLDEALQNPSAKPKAIVTDIDETVLDNSAYEAHQTLQNKDYESATWYNWTDRSAADTVPGAPSFFKYAASKGVEVFYITNREERERSSTLLNLKKFNFPNTDETHLITKQTTSSKEARRVQVAATHDIILLLGDNLADFSAMFDKKTVDERSQNVNTLATEFGKRFIVLPNPVYGDWESSLMKYNYGLTPAQKDSVIKSVIRSY